MIENPELRAIFLMLRSELQDKDIPHRTTLRQHILERLDEYLERLSNDMKVCNSLVFETNYNSDMGTTLYTVIAWEDFFYYGYVV